MDLAEMRELVDIYQRTRDERLALQKRVDAIHEHEKAYAASILTTLRDQEAPVMGGSTHQCTRKVQNEPTVEDWDTLYWHIHATSEWDLLHKRLSAAAVKERWELGEEVPGVGSFPVEKLSLTKLPEGA
jgi:hypothetical protein